MSYGGTTAVSTTSAPNAQASTLHITQIHPERLVPVAVAKEAEEAKDAEIPPSAQAATEEIKQLLEQIAPTIQMRQALRSGKWDLFCVYKLEELKKQREASGAPPPPPEAANSVHPPIPAEYANFTVEEFIWEGLRILLSRGAVRKELLGFIGFDKTRVRTRQDIEADRRQRMLEEQDRKKENNSWAIKYIRKKDSIHKKDKKTA